jgi:peptidoglycan/LPS O-acetylase OafA/YrhL
MAHRLKATGSRAPFVAGIRPELQRLMARVYTSPDSSNRLIPMEGLRGAAILLVFFCHYNVLVGRFLVLPYFPADLLQTLARMGTSGVDLFFLLSGFLIYRATLRPNLKYFRFIARRARRIYPPFLAVFAFYVVVCQLAPSLARVGSEERHSLPYLALNLLLLPGFVNISPLVSVAWSLSYEWYFYLALPLVILGLRLYHWNWKMRATLFLTLSVLYLVFSFIAPELGSVLHYPIYRTHVRLVMFFCGIVVSELVRVPKLVLRISARFEIVIIGTVCIGAVALFLLEWRCVDMQSVKLLLPRFEAYRTVVLFVVCFATVLCCLARPTGTLGRIFSCYELRWLGNISYSYYLVHTIPLNVIKALLPRISLGARYPTVQYAFLLGIGFAASVAAAVILFLLVERRFSLLAYPEASKIVPSAERANPQGFDAEAEGPRLPDLGPTCPETGARAGVKEIPLENSMIDRILRGRGVTVIRLARVPQSKVRLSVVIPNYNTAEFVEFAVHSALNQTYSDIEVIVVDDGSTDDSVRRILSIADHRLTCVTQENRGLSGARNTGILLARGEYIGFLDSDDTWYPDKARKHVALMNADRQLGLTFSHSAYLNEEGVETGHLLISSCKAPTAIDLTKRNHVGNGSTPVVRRVCFDEAGWFDEGLRSCEDIEMWVRLAARTSFKLRLIPEILTGYRVREGSLSVAFDRFVADGRRAVERFGLVIPNFPQAASDRALAQIVRVASRKAFSSGHIEQSRSLLWIALCLSPGMPFYDSKAMVLTGLHVSALFLPRRSVNTVYRAVQRCMRQWYSVTKVRGVPNV